MTDFDSDPGPINFSDNGSFFGKLLARNILDGKQLKVYNYAIADGVSYEISTAIYFIESSQLSGNQFKITGKDALKDIEKFNEQFPTPSTITLTADITESQLTIPVTETTGLAAIDRVIIGEEIIRIDSLTANSITCTARGADQIGTGGILLYRTTAEAHDSGDTVQLCYVMNAYPLANMLTTIYNHVGLSAYVDFTQWNNEITEWNSSALLYGIFTEPAPAIDLINQMLEVYMVDMWLNQSTQKVVVSAVSAWKESIRTLSEVNDIQNLKVKTQPNQRYSRAYITHRKPYQALSDDKNNYKKYTVYTDTASESSDLYGDVSMYEFDPCRFISDSSSTILASRFVQRFNEPPKEISFNIEERKLSGTSLGDVVDIISRDSQLPDGTEYGGKITAQITQLKPVVNGIGRYYAAKALSYIPLIDTGGGPLVIFISGTVFDLNLYDRAGAPASAVDVTFVLQGATIGSSSSQYAMRAGNFASGSTVKIIATAGTKWAAKGGLGGTGGTGVPGDSSGQVGSDSYQSDSITTQIYLNYGVVDTYTTDGELYAAGGGGGCVIQDGTGTGRTLLNGGGGSGIPGGLGGVTPPSATYTPTNGSNGSFSAGGLGGVFGGSIAAGDGGFSLDGVAGNDGGVPIYVTYPGGSAGGAFKGTGITVYNLAASASKLRDGNSDVYTLVT